MKKVKLFKSVFCCLLVAVMLLALGACATAPTPTPPGPDADADDGADADVTDVPEETGVLVIYTPFIPDTVDPILEMFYEETGIRATAIQAGTGELLSRVRAEAANPQADIFWGGNITTTLSQAELFADFQSINESYIPEHFRNVEGPFTRFDIATSVLMINTEFIGDIEIRGYADLLNPELRGRIALTDPSASASAFLHLANKLYAMGDGDPDAGWDFVEAFLENVDGVMLPGSSAVFNGVANGEYWVGLTFDGAPQPFIQADAPVEMIHMVEGNVFDAGAVKIINNAPNRASAEAFVNFVTGQEVQDFIDIRFLRPVRQDVTGNDVFVPLDEIRRIPAELSDIMENRDEWLDRFRELREG